MFAGFDDHRCGLTCVPGLPFAADCEITRPRTNFVAIFVMLLTCFHDMRHTSLSFQRGFSFAAIRPQATQFTVQNAAHKSASRI